MTTTDQHKLWILSLGFKNNTSADFKAWIMYNNPDTYSSTKQLSIRYSDLNILKDTHNYTSLKGTIDAPWFKFLHKLRNNIRSPILCVFGKPLTVALIDPTEGRRRCCRFGGFCCGSDASYKNMDHSHTEI